MKPYWSNERHGLSIYHGDCLDVLRGMDECSVDMLATDPPYALSDAHRKGNSLFDVLGKVGFPQFAEDVPGGNGRLASGLVPFYLGDSVDSTGASRGDAGVNVTVPVIDLDEHIELGQEKVGDIPPPAFGIIEGELPAVCNAESSQCLGYFVLKFGMLDEDTVGHSYSTTSAGFFPDGFWYRVRLSDHALAETEGTPAIVASPGTEVAAVFAFELGRASANLLPADGADDPDRDFLHACPQLVRASSAACGLAAPLQALRVSIVDRATNRTSALHFHLLVPPDLWDKLSPIIAHKGFMGKAWDGTLPDPAIWRECLRVLKPGGAACVMSGARLDCLWRMCRDLEEAGFELVQSCFTWLYRSGFPKGGDLSKMADKRAGAEREVVGKNPHSCAGRAPGIMHIAGTNKRPRMEQRMTDEGYDKPPLTAPATPLAVALDGQFTRGKLKPAMEFIIWARKPISEATEFDNVVRWGTGAVNCGKCMVPFGDSGAWTEAKTRILKSGQGGMMTSARPDATSGRRPGYTDKPNPSGRYPANVLCMDDALGEGSRYFDIDAWAAEHGIAEDGWADAAAAGMIQVPKPSRAEKEAGLDGFPANSDSISLGRRKCSICGAWEYREAQPNLRRCECEEPDWELIQAKRDNRNIHPSCKPVRLFSYLIHLLCPSGGLVLDPFCGSGTTGVAAVQAGYQFIGCDMEQEYCEIARARIEHAVLDREIAQGRLFEPGETAPKAVQGTLEVDA